MSDVITEVGQFTQKNGRAARVVHIEEGIAFGFDSEDDPCGWDVKTGVESTEAEPAEGYNIVGPWIDPPAFSVGDLVLVDSPSTALHQHYGEVEKVSDRHTVRFGNVGVAYFNTEELIRVALPAPLPAGYRLKPRNVMAVPGDIGTSRIHAPSWIEVSLSQSWQGSTCESFDLRIPSSAPYFFAEPIPVPEPPTVDVGEGWRRIDGDPDCVIVKGDEFKSMLDGYWSAMNVSIGKTVAEYQKTVGSPRIIRRRVPKPFRISTNGPGVYERADGKEFEVDVTPERQFQTGLSSDFIWWNEKDAEAWRDDGTWHLKGSRELPALNLVRYLRPLPKPAVDPEVWLPTTDIRLSAEQRFERNGVSKWMPVTFQEGT